MNKLCCICHHPLNSEDAPVIAMGGYGNPKCACESCEALIDTATTSRDPEKISEACKSLGEALTAGNTGDEQIIDTVNDIIRSASERGAAIKEGTYDFALDEADAEDEFDITIPAVEIIPESGFYDYKNKYQGTTREVCPAEIDGETANRVAALSRLAFSALRLGGYARFDFMLDRNGGLWCLEANTLPGMTPTSLLPMAASAVGISYGELCEQILNL